jgi:hypothetical protein
MDLNIGGKKREKVDANLQSCKKWQLFHNFISPQPATAAETATVH